MLSVRVLPACVSACQMHAVLTEVRRGHWIPGSRVTVIVSCHVGTGNVICVLEEQLVLLWLNHLPSISPSSRVLTPSVRPRWQSCLGKVIVEGPPRRALGTV